MFVLCDEGIFFYFMLMKRYSLYFTKQNKFSLENLYILSVYVFFLKPGFIEDVDYLNFIFNLLRFLLSIIFIFRLFCQSNKIYNLTSSAYPFAIFIIALISTWYNAGDFKSVFGHWVPIIGIIAYISYNRKKIAQITKIFFRIGEFLIIANTISIIIFPDGIWTRDYIQIYLLGQKQDFVICYFSTLVFGFLFFETNHTKVKKIDFFVCFMTIYSIVVTKPIGLAVCLLIFLFLTALDKKIKVNLFLLFYFALFCNLFAILTSLFFRNNDFLKYFLSVIPSSGLDKLSTITSRFEMWNFALDTLENKFLIGVGQLTRDKWFELSNLNYFHSVIHNLPLDIAFIGGFISLFIYLAWNMKQIKMLQRNKIQKARILGIALISFNVLCITECPYKPLLFILFGFSSDYVMNYLKIKKEH